MSKKLTTLTLTEGERPVTGSPLVRGATLGRYVVLDLLGSGGMGVVYAAYDFGLDRRVCLKLVRDGRAERSAERQERLLREARAAARVSHPNVVTVHDVGTWEDHVFVAMELVEGSTLRKWLRAADRSLSEILEVFTQAARGLSAAHAAGLVHRDFKPDNVLVGNDGRVRVTDFGLAREISTLPATDSGSHTSGTPAYMAPEQHRGEPASAATDQFSFALALYEAVYRSSPYAGTTADALRADKSVGRIVTAPSRPKVPGWVRTALLQGLSPDRPGRHASMDAFVSALRPPRKSRRLVAGSVATVAATGFALVFAQPKAPPSAEVVTSRTILALTESTDAAQCADPATSQVTHSVFAARLPDALPAKNPSMPTPPWEELRATGTFDFSGAAQATTTHTAVASNGSSSRVAPSFTVHLPEKQTDGPDREGLLALVSRLERALTELGLLEAPMDLPLPVLASLGPMGASETGQAGSLLDRYGEVLAGRAVEQRHHGVFSTSHLTAEQAEVRRLETELATTTSPVEAATLKFALARALYSTDTVRALRLAREAQETLRGTDLADARNLLNDLEDWLDDYGSRIARTGGL